MWKLGVCTLKPLSCKDLAVGDRQLCEKCGYGGKLKQRWDKALIRLTELEWQIIYDSETYLEWLRTESTTGKPKDCKKRIIDLLLEAGITIKPPVKFQP